MAGVSAQGQKEDTVAALPAPPCRRFFLPCPQSAGVSAVGVALVASAAKGLLVKCCWDKDEATAHVRAQKG